MLRSEDDRAQLLYAYKRESRGASERCTSSHIENQLCYSMPAPSDMRETNVACNGVVRWEQESRLRTSIAESQRHG